MGLYSFLKPSFGFTDIWGNDWAWRLGKRDRRVTKPQAPNYYTIEVLVRSYGGQFTLLVWPHHHSFRPSTKFQVITEGSATRNAITSSEKLECVASESSISEGILNNLGTEKMLLQAEGGLTAGNWSGGSVRTLYFWFHNKLTKRKLQEDFMV